MILIRPAQESDVPALARLGARLVAVHHDFDPARFIAATPMTARGYGEFLSGEIGQAQAIVLVAEDAGVALGYAYATLEGVDYMALRGPAGVLNDLVVDPARGGEGIGRRLLDAILAALVERGAPRVVLSTAERNIAAQTLFAGRGFRRTMIEMTWEPEREG